ncbi:MAG: SPOR domain-containing protein [Bacteroidales bacterium]|nr:SPOR domain-containing protein [Bacteroidales bacterium]
MTIKQILILSFFLLGVLLLKGQEMERGRLTIYQDPLADSLLKKHIAVNKLYPVIRGYRIQIFFDSGNRSKTQALETLAQFKAEYPGIGAYISFEAPYYKVRVGDYRSRLDAEKALREIVRDYPNGFIVQDYIQLPPID